MMGLYFSLGSRRVIRESMAIRTFLSLGFQRYSWELVRWSRGVVCIFGDQVALVCSSDIELFNLSSLLVFELLQLFDSTLIYPSSTVQNRHWYILVGSSVIADKLFCVMKQKTRFPWSFFPAISSSTGTTTVLLYFALDEITRLLEKISLDMIALLFFRFRWSFYVSQFEF